MKTYEDYAEFEPKFKEMENWTLPNVLEHQAEEWRDSTYLEWETTGDTTSFEETNRISNRLAHGFIDLGVEKGEKVLLMLPNSPEYLYLWFGLSKMGGVEVPVNTDYKKRSLRHVANLTEAKVGVVHDKFIPRFTEIEDDLNHLETAVVIGEGSVDASPESDFEFIPYEDIISNEDQNPEVDISYYDIGGIIMTSGTTGPSKAIQMTYAHQYFFSEECRNLVQLTEEDVYMTANPLFHANAQCLVAFPALIAGAKLHLFEEFSASEWVDRLNETGATVSNFLGSMMDFVFQQPEREIDDKNNLRCLFAAPTAFGIKKEFEERFGIDFISEVYGSTETSMPVLTPYGVERPEGAAGLLLEEYFDMDLVDPVTDRVVEQGKMGEAAVRSKIPWITTTGYFGMDERTVQAMRNFHLHTEDGLRQGENGWFYYVDRIGDTLRRRGENISSYEVEKPILDHPAVEECAVVAGPSDEEGGEDEVKAFIVLKSGKSATLEEISEWCQNRLPEFMNPRFLEFVDELPKTSNEKIKKKDLRERGNSEDTWDRLAD